MFWPWSKKKTLPFPEGPFITGCVDVMDNCSKDSLFVRLIYPTDANIHYLDKNSHRWVPWFPEDKYIESFSILLNLWLVVLRFILWLMGKDVYIPTLWEEPVTNEVKKLRVVVFSHGYGATRFLCSTICNELASRGYLVVCLEHRDESASLTYYYASESARNRDERTYILAKPFVAMDMQHYLLRNGQMKYRSYECSKVLQLLSQINNGSFQNKFRSNFDLSCFKDKIDLSDPVLMGHSFGGATSIYALAKDDRFKLGIILDGWMFPLKNEPQMNVNKPLLFINSQTFSINANIQMMRTFSTLPQSTLYTIRNTTHESHTDTPIVFGYWLNFMMKKLNSNVALKIQNYLVLDFLHKYHGLQLDENQIERYLSFQSENIVKDYILHSTQGKKHFTMW